MAGIVSGLNTIANYKVARTLPVDEQNQAFTTFLNFSNTQLTDQFDLTGDDRAYNFSWASMYVDNSSANAVTVIFIIGGTGQRITVKPNTQGYYPVIASARDEGGSNLSAIVSAPTAGVNAFLVQVMLINYKVDPAVWPTV